MAIRFFTTSAERIASLVFGVSLTEPKSSKSELWRPLGCFLADVAGVYWFDDDAMPKAIASRFMLAWCLLMMSFAEMADSEDCETSPSRVGGE